MPFSKCLRAKIYGNMNVYFDPQGCQTLLLKESNPLLFSLGSWTKWTGMDFASSTRAAENRSRWKGIVANSSVVPRQPSKVMG